MVDRNVTTIGGARMIVLTMLGCGLLFLPDALRCVGWIFGSILIVITAAMVGLTGYYTCVAGKKVLKIIKKEKNQNQSEDGKSGENGESFIVQTNAKVVAVASDTKEDDDEDDDESEDTVGEDGKKEGELVTYYEVIRKSHWIVAQIVDFFLVFSTCIAVFTYICLITKTMMTLGQGYIQKYHILIFLIGLLFVMSIWKDLSALSFLSYIAIVASGVLFIVIFLIFLVNHKHTTTRKAVFSGFPSAISTILFSLSCQQNMLSIFSQLENQSRKNIINMLLIACITASILYALIGIFGYMAIGQGTKGSLIEIFTNNRGLEMEKVIDDIEMFGFEFGYYSVRFVTILYFFALISAAVFEINPAKISIKNILVRWKIMNEEAFDGWTYHIITTIVILFIGTLFGVFELEPKLLISISGAIISTTLSFMLPCFAYIMLIKNKNIILNILAYLVMVVSAILMFYILFFIVKGFRDSRRSDSYTLGDFANSDMIEMFTIGSYISTH
ncbi:Amino Acid/Auxin Permease (AAAP) Family [Pseudoloma neurophilia]|uniref:Amino Acid/Auxin Permease (AAAP) Family n=1 Tax=Pseudoloma neurophilia TaxID=146866 RepID=A0A0R0M5L1_9MICR|nr:Amino Acid/Auxin Permease (AAAP) Family [Pseudoloma neurophilia]